MAISDQREIIDGTYSVTELNKPGQAVYLSRHNPWWVDPESMVFMLNGTAVHSIFEQGGKDLGPDHILERRGYCEIGTKYGPVQLRGTFDYYDGTTKTLWDVKNSKPYPVLRWKKAQGWQDEDYFVQLNVYRAFFVPEAEHLKMWALLGGWSKYNPKKVKTLYWEGVNKIEKVNVPMADPQLVREFVRARLETFMGYENGVAVKSCTRKDMYENVPGIPTRCMEYCNVADCCPQHQKFLADRK